MNPGPTDQDQRSQRRTGSTGDFTYGSIKCTFISKDTDEIVCKRN